MSLVESFANIVVGILISAITNAIVLPLFGFSPSWGQLAGITAIFTVVSLVRSYALRRVFESRTRRAHPPKMEHVT
jgi:hypothetical protein